MARVVINMAQTEHEHVYENMPAAHPEYLWLGCDKDGVAGQDCGQAHFAHEYCLSTDDVFEFHPLNWLIEYEGEVLYEESDTVDYLNYDADIVRVAIHQARQHRHSFEIPYPIEEEDNFVHIDEFPGLGFSGGCWSDFPKTVTSGCFFTKDESFLYNIHVELSDPITMVVYNGTTGVDPMIGNDTRHSHFHYYKALVGDAYYCLEGSFVYGLVMCCKGHEKCFYAVKTVDDTPTGGIKYNTIPGYYPPPSGAYPYPPDAGFEGFYLDRATELGVS